MPSNEERKGFYSFAKLKPCELIGWHRFAWVFGIECATYLSYSPSLQPFWGTHFRTLGPVTIESALLSRIASIKRGSTGGAGGSRTHTVWFFRPALRPRKLPPQMQGTNYWSYISNINFIIAVCALLSVVLRSSGTFFIGETKNSELFLED